MKLPKKYAPAFTAVGTGLLMGLLMSFVTTVLNVGVGPNFLPAWGRSFIVGVLVGIPTALSLSPQLTKSI